jgi:hypothetical protein
MPVKPFPGYHSGMSNQSEAQSAAGRGSRRGFDWVQHARVPKIRQGAVASRRDLIAPILLSIAAILLTSLLIHEAHAHLTALQIGHDAEELALAYILPTIFITVLFGSNIGVLTALYQTAERLTL